MTKAKPLAIDSSVAVKWISGQGERFIRQSDLILKKAQSGEITIVMPELAKYEIGNALLYKEMDLTATQIALGTVYAIPIQFILQDLEMAQESMRIAKSSRMTYYDATFIALARRFKADLITDNPKHQKKYKGKEVKIITLKDYK